MFKPLIVLTAAAGFVLAASHSASAFLPGQWSVFAASQEFDNSVQVKKKFKKIKYKKAKGIPPGWYQGRKTGWGAWACPLVKQKKYMDGRTHGLPQRMTRRGGQDCTA